MRSGQVLFQGTTVQMLQETQGKVRIFSAQGGNKPEGNFTIVSTLNMGSTIQYRVVGESSSIPGSTSVEPSLEEGYVWMMRKQSDSAAATAL